MKRFLCIAFVLLVVVSSFGQGNSGYTLADQVNSVRQKQATVLTSITSGTATTLNNSNGQVWVVVNPASTLAAHRITLPSAPVNGHTAIISFGGSLTGTVVTSLTISPASSQTIIQASVPTTANAGTSLAYRFNAFIAKWFRLY